MSKMFWSRHNTHLSGRGNQSDEISDSQGQLPDPVQSESHQREPDQQSPDDEVPQFGLVDVIEAFTAMRHESRSQIRESRDVSEALRNTASQIADLENKLLATLSQANHATRQAESDAGAVRLAETIVEIDNTVTRAVATVTSLRESSGGGDSAARDVDQLKLTLRDLYGSLGPIARWFCRPFADHVDGAVGDWAASQAVEQDPTLDGLEMLVQRIRRLMADQQIERVEATGQPFDAETMNAVESLATASELSGHVIEQLCPAYRWRGRLIKYADVRVAR
jgi:molecular chaperone GrpE